MFLERWFGYSTSKQKMMSFRGQAGWAIMTSSGGQANSTGMPPDQKSKQSWVTNLSLYKLWMICSNHRHLRNLDCLMARTTWLVCFKCTVNSRSKKGKCLGRCGASSWHTTKLKQSIFFRYLWFQLFYFEDLFRAALYSFIITIQSETF